MKRNIGPSRDERRENEWQDVVSDVEEQDADGKGGVKEDAETGKAEKDSTFGILENSTVSDLDSNRTGSSIMIALGTWGASLISLLGVTPTSKQAQTIYMGFMLVLSLVPILALVIQNGTSLNEVLKQVVFHLVKMFRFCFCKRSWSWLRRAWRPATTLQVWWLIYNRRGPSTIHRRHY